MSKTEKSMEENKQSKKRISKIEKYEKQIYDLKQLLEISKSLCSLLDYSKLIESILYICMCQVHTLGAGIFVKKDLSSEKFELGTYHSGLEVKGDTEYSIGSDSKLADFLNKNQKAYTLEELQKKLPKVKELSCIASLSPSLIAPVQEKNRLVGILILGERIDLGEGIEYSKYEKEQITSIASLSAIAISNASLVEMTTTDMMTRLKLKHYFYTVLEDKVDEAQRTESPLAVLMLDIDHFKRFNDTYGHACGDYVLQQVAKIISEGVRTHDLAARYGGEEFVVLLGNTDAPSAMMVAERIRKNIENCDFNYENQHMTVTISIGVAVLKHGKKISPAKLVEHADEALYISKNNGRNRSSFAPIH